MRYRHAVAKGMRRFAVASSGGVSGTTVVLGTLAYEQALPGLATLHHGRTALGALAYEQTLPGMTTINLGAITQLGSLTYEQTLPGMTTIGHGIAVLGSLAYEQTLPALTTATPGSADVANMTELLAALATASDGDTITTASGSFGDFDLDAGDSISFSPAVTIKSVDAGNPTSYNHVKFTSVTGIAIEDSVLDYTTTSGTTVDFVNELVSCDDITIKNTHVSGDDAFGAGSPYDGYGIGVAFEVTNCNYVTIENCEIDDWERCGIFIGCTHVTVQSCDVHNFSADAFDVQECSYITFDDNDIYDCIADPTNLVHQDMIQFIQETDQGVHDHVTITNNRLIRGTGNATQTIFLESQAWVADNGTAPWTNITITGNVIYNGLQQGIVVTKSAGLVISNNTLLFSKGGYLAEGTESAPTVDVITGSTSVTITDNVGHSFPAAEGGWTVSGNQLVQRDYENLATYFQALFVNALNDDYATIRDLMALPGGTIETADIGAAQAIFDATPTSLAPVVQWTFTATPNEVDFSAALTANASGLVASGSATWSWDFGDESGTASTQEPTYEYAAPGSYVVSLTVNDGSEEVTVQSDLFVPGNVLLDVRVDSGDFIEASEFASPIIGSGVTFGSGSADPWGRTEWAIYDTADSAYWDRNTVKQLFAQDVLSISVKLRAMTTAGSLFYLPANAISLQVNAGGTITAYVTPDGDSAVSFTTGATDVLDGNPHEVCWVFDGASAETLTVYVDGSSVGSAAASGITVQISTDNPEMGNILRPGFAGLLSSLTLYNTIETGSAVGAGTTTLDALAYEQTLPGMTTLHHGISTLGSLAYEQTLLGLTTATPGGTNLYEWGDFSTAAAVASTAHISITGGVLNFNGANLFEEAPGQSNYFASVSDSGGDVTFDLDVVRFVGSSTNMRIKLYYYDGPTTSDNYLGDDVVGGGTFTVTGTGPKSIVLSSAGIPTGATHMKLIFEATTEGADLDYDNLVVTQA